MNRDQFLRKCELAYLNRPPDEDEEDDYGPLRNFDNVLADGLDDDEHEPDGTERT